MAKAEESIQEDTPILKEVGEELKLKHKMIGDEHSEQSRRGSFRPNPLATHPFAEYIAARLVFDPVYGGRNGGATPATSTQEILRRYALIEDYHSNLRSRR